MRPFYTKDGRFIVPVDHFADFTGKNNSSKSKVLIWLLHIKGQRHDIYLSAGQLHDETGVNYDTIKARLPFWYNIRYVDRKMIALGGKPMWGYRIDERGEHFVNNRIPIEKRNQYIEEINLWRKRKAVPVTVNK